MSKRFFDTEKFNDEWYRRLPLKYKLLWDYLLCKCDHAGIVKIDLDLASFFIGDKLEDGCLSKFFSERLIHLRGFKYFIPKFISFQYGPLGDSNPHKAVLRRLKEEGIDIDLVGKPAPILTLAQPFPNSIDTTKDQDQDKAQDKVKAKDKDKECVKKLSEMGSVVSPEWLVVEYFNKVNGKDLKQIDANYKLIKTRLKEGFTVDEMKLVIDFTFKTWTNDPFWHRLNRISTIFNGRFNEYLDQAQNATSDEFSPNIEAAREMYRKHFGHYPDEVQNNDTLDQEPA